MLVGQFVVGALGSLLAGGLALAQSTTRVSVSSSGAQGNLGSFEPSISADGRFVAFQSDASNLVAGDTNASTDVFVHDRASGQTVRVSLGSSGVQGDGPSSDPELSADGRIVAFRSAATNLVAGDLNGRDDVFVHDRQTGLTTLASVSSGGAQGDAGSIRPALSADGRFVAFQSIAGTLVAGDTTGQQDVFVHDLQTGATTRVSVDSSGVPGNSHSSAAALSADGRFVAFSSYATNLAPGDSGGVSDVFLHDRLTGQTTAVSLGSSGVSTVGGGVPALSGDGRFVAFVTSGAIDPLDTNAKNDVYVRDVQLGVSTRVSVSSTGTQISVYSCMSPALSADGAFVAFVTDEGALVPGDTNACLDVLVHERATGLTHRVSVSTSGVEGDEPSDQPSLSADGRYVAFRSAATTLVAGDTNARRDVFVHDEWTTCYLDADGDGFGAGAPAFSTQGACGAGYAANDRDCDDSDPSIHPGAPELCNGVDDDCDGAADDGLMITYWLDADGDGWGAANASVTTCAGQPAGYASQAGDCDDGDPAVHPGAPERCNGIDDDCDGAVDEVHVQTYCTAGVTVQGCVPSISGTGVPSSSSASGFDIAVANVPGGRNGLIFYGLGPIASTWAFGSTSYLCVVQPVQRTGVQDSGGTGAPCGGKLRVDFNSWRQANPGALGAPFFAGQVLYAQGWFRDPGAPTGTNLSDGLSYTLCD